MFVLYTLLLLFSAYGMWLALGENVILFCPFQGDQIGRIFDHWVIVYFGHYFSNWQKFAAIFFQG
jgi:hypothetical protein